jgi:hypothetical protein
LRAERAREIAGHSIVSRALGLKEQLDSDELSLEKLAAAQRQSHRNLYGMLQALWTSGSPDIGEAHQTEEDPLERIIQPPYFPNLHLTSRVEKQEDGGLAPIYGLSTTDEHWGLGVHPIGPEMPITLTPSPDGQAMYEDDCDTVRRLFDALNIEVPEQFRTEPLLNNPAPTK